MGSKRGYEDGSVNSYNKNVGQNIATAGKKDNKEYRTYFDFDTSQIPDGAKILSVTLHVYVNSVEGQPKHSVHKLSQKNADRDFKDVWADMASCSNEAGVSDCYVSEQSILGANSWKEIDLGPDAATDLESLLGSDYFGVGIRGPSEDVKYSNLRTSESVDPPYITVVFETTGWPVVAGKNLVKNGGFEEKYLRYWADFDDKSNIQSAEVVNSDNAEGAYSLKLENSGNTIYSEYYIITQTVDVEENTDYFLGAAIKANTLSGTCQVDFYNRFGEGPDSHGINATSTDGWQYFAEHVRTPLNANHVDVRILAIGPINGGCSFDDIMLVKKE